jgi:hypothetical protein
VGLQAFTRTNKLIDTPHSATPQNLSRRFFSWEMLKTCPIQLCFCTRGAWLKTFILLVHLLLPLRTCFIFSVHTFLLPAVEPVSCPAGPAGQKKSLRA